jgi:hypothetical protein
VIRQLSSVDDIVGNRFSSHRPQPLPIRANILIAFLLVFKICQNESLGPFRFPSILGRKPRIPRSESDVWNISIQTFLFTLTQIDWTAIIAIGYQHPPLEVIAFIPKGFHVLFGPFYHGTNMIMILPFSKGLRMNNNLMFRIDEYLSIISLNRPMGGHHSGRFVIRHITLDLLPISAQSDSMPLQKLPNPLGVLLELIYLLHPIQ